MAYLDDHPPKVVQQRCPRRDAPSGVVVLHSAENVPDLNPPDTGADAVAKFIVGRNEQASYHTICDSDSRIRLVDYGCEAFGDATGSNRHAIHISGAFTCAQWSTLPQSWRDGVVEQMALDALDARTWLAGYGVDLPARSLTREQSEARMPGFITHALRDPERRSDPGAECARLVVLRYAELTAPDPPEPPEDDMPKTTACCRDSLGRGWFFYIASIAGDVWAKVDGGTKFQLPQPSVIVGDLEAICGNGGTLDVYGRGTDGKLWTTHNNGSAFSPWVAV